MIQILKLINKQQWTITQCKLKRKERLNFITIFTATILHPSEELKTTQTVFLVLNVMFILMTATSTALERHCSVLHVSPSHQVKISHQHTPVN